MTPRPGQRFLLDRYELVFVALRGPDYIFLPEHGLGLAPIRLSAEDLALLRLVCA